MVDGMTCSVAVIAPLEVEMRRNYNHRGRALQFVVVEVLAAKTALTAG